MSSDNTIERLSDVIDSLVDMLDRANTDNVHLRGQLDALQGEQPIWYAEAGDGPDEEHPILRSDAEQAELDKLLADLTQAELERDTLRSENRSLKAEESFRDHVATKADGSRYRHEAFRHRAENGRLQAELAQTRQQLADLRGEERERLMMDEERGAFRSQAEVIGRENDRLRAMLDLWAKESKPQSTPAPHVHTFEGVDGGGGTSRKGGFVEIDLSDGPVIMARSEWDKVKAELTATQKKLEEVGGELANRGSLLQESINSELKWRARAEKLHADVASARHIRGMSRTLEAVSALDGILARNHWTD